VTEETPYSTRENMGSRSTSKPHVSEPKMPYSNMTGPSASDSAVTEIYALDFDMSENTVLDQLPSHENMELKSASDLNDPEPNAATTPEGLPLLENTGETIFSGQNKTNITNIASDQLLSRMVLKNPPNQYVTEPNSSVSNMAVLKASDSTVPSVGKGFEDQLRRPQHGRERNHLHLVISSKVGKELTDEQLRDILQKSPNERNKAGKIINMDFVFQFVPREYEGFSIDDMLAVYILRAGTEAAVRRRFAHTGS
jgi:hypothetical protein